MRYVSQNLVNCCTTAGTSCTTNPQQIEIMELEHTVDRRTVSYVRLAVHDAYSVVGVVNKLDYRRVLLITSPRGKYPDIWRYRNFIVTQCRIGGRKVRCRFVQPFPYNSDL